MVAFEGLYEDAELRKQENMMTIVPLEAQILRACLDWLKAKRIYAFRVNTSGIFDPKRGCFRSFHGKKGVSDILGILSQEVVVDGEEHRFGNFLAVECKRPGGRMTPEQEEFLWEVENAGGIGICVHSVEELEEKLSPYLL